jgi:hypothetical protein
MLESPTPGPPAKITAKEKLHSPGSPHNPEPDRRTFALEQGGKIGSQARPRRLLMAHKDPANLAGKTP